MPITYLDAKDQLTKIYLYSGITLNVALFDDLKLSTPVTVTGVNTSTNYLTATSNYVNSVKVRISSTVTVPDPFDPDTDYWVINLSGSTFQLSLTPDGAAVDITTTGSGTIILTEQMPDQYSSLAAWTRLESTYQGTSRQTITFAGKVPELDFSQSRVYLDAESYAFAPTSGDVDFRAIGIIADGSNVAGNTSGRLRAIYDFGVHQTIPNQTVLTKLFMPYIEV